MRVRARARPRPREGARATATRRVRARARAVGARYRSTTAGSASLAMIFAIALLRLLLVSSVPVYPGSTLTPQWITGALISGSTRGVETTVCSTSNGCTDGAFLACSDASQKITNITFASYVSFCSYFTCRRHLYTLIKAAATKLTKF